MQPEYITLHKNAKDITGQTFGRLVVLGPISRASNRAIIWLCRCACGTTRSIVSRSLLHSATLSCGCLKRDNASELNKTHGLSGNPLYGRLDAMIQRCYNPKHREYRNYGARGITVCDEWKQNPQAFFDHVSQLPNFGQPSYTIDRIDNSLGYTPGNVRWASPTEQNINRRVTRFYTFNGQSMPLTEWAKTIGVSERSLRFRLRSGWSIERTLSQPINTKRKG